MLPVLVLTLCVLVVVSLPFWLPKGSSRCACACSPTSTATRDSVPGDLVGAAQFKEVYSHPAANGRSRGAGLSDLFWYWLSPGAELHQEHLEAGDRYEEIAHTTRRILGVARTGPRRWRSDARHGRSTASTAPGWSGSATS